MQSKLKILAFIAVTLAFSCEEEQKTFVDPTVATDSLTIELAPSVKEEVPLSPGSQEYLKAFDEYLLLKETIQDLNGKTVAELKSEIDGWSESALKFYKTAQDSTFEQPMESRILLLYTKIRLLHQELVRVPLDSATVKVEATELYNTFQDLNGQFNVKFLPSVDDFLKEFQENSSNSPTNAYNPILRPNLPPARGQLKLEQVPDTVNPEEL